MIQYNSFFVALGREDAYLAPARAVIGSKGSEPKECGQLNA